MQITEQQFAVTTGDSPGRTIVGERTEHRANIEGFGGESLDRLRHHLVEIQRASAGVEIQIVPAHGQRRADDGPSGDTGDGAHPGQQTTFVQIGEHARVEQRCPVASAGQAQSNPRWLM